MRRGSDPEIFRNKPVIELYLKIVHSSNHRQTFEEVTVEGALIMSDHLGHLVKVSSFSIGASSYVILFGHLIVVSRTFQVISFSIALPGGPAVSQAFIGLCVRRTLRAGDESISRGNKGLGPSCAGSGGYQPSLFP